MHKAIVRDGQLVMFGFADKTEVVHCNVSDIPFTDVSFTFAGDRTDNFDVFDPHLLNDYSVRSSFEKGAGEVAEAGSLNLLGRKSWRFDTYSLWDCIAPKALLRTLK